MRHPKKTRNPKSCYVKSETNPNSQNPNNKTKIAAGERGLKKFLIYVIMGPLKLMKKVKVIR